jgi:hypothetical protein
MIDEPGHCPALPAVDGVCSLFVVVIPRQFVWAVLIFETRELVQVEQVTRPLPIARACATLGFLWANYLPEVKVNELALLEWFGRAESCCGVSAKRENKFKREKDGIQLTPSLLSRLENLQLNPSAFLNDPVSALRTARARTITFEYGSGVVFLHATMFAVGKPSFPTRFRI